MTNSKVRPTFFEGSPFVLTADPQIGACWAGRPQILSNVRRLVRTLENRPDSTLDLIWANFGSGKSHVLFHIAHLLSTSNTGAVTAFVEIPEQLRNFIDLYRRIVTGLPWKRIAPLIEDSRLENISTDLRRSARVIAHGNSTEQNVAIEWVSAGRPHIRDLRSLMDISARIEDDVRAADILSNIIRVFAANKVRLVLLLDEFQRLGHLQERYRSAILSSLRSLFSGNPSGLSVIAAATTRIEKTALDILPSELRTLMGMRPAIALPEMNPEEALEFVAGRFRCFRPQDYRGGPADPIGDPAIRETIRYIVDETGTRLIPRTILQALSWVFDETIEGEYPVAAPRANALLKELSWESAGNGARE